MPKIPCLIKNDFIIEKQTIHIDNKFENKNCCKFIHRFKNKILKNSNLNNLFSYNHS